MTDRERLRGAARAIAARYGARPSGPWKALRKLFVQERRDYSVPEPTHVGWKRGELFEVFLAFLGDGDVAEEWGDVGYYVAQTFAPLWQLYALITPQHVVERAVEKFERRAR